MDNLLEESRRRTSEVAKSCLPLSDDSASSSTHKRKTSRKEKTSYHNPVLDVIQDQPLTSDCRYPIDDPQPVTSAYRYDSTNALESVASVYEHNATNSPHILTADDTYNPDTSYVHTTDSEYYAPNDSTNSPITSYSSGNLPLTTSTEINEVIDLNTRGYRRTRQSWGHNDNSNVRKTCRRH